MSERPLPAPGTATGIAEDLEIARRRMKHLAPWHVAPLPQTQVARTAAAATPPATSAEQARRKHLALQVLAVQMGHARPGSALR
jgi:hypothetical protein